MTETKFNHTLRHRKILFFIAALLISVPYLVGIGTAEAQACDGRSEEYCPTTYVGCFQYAAGCLGDANGTGIGCANLTQVGYTYTPIRCPSGYSAQCSSFFNNYTFCANVGICLADSNSEPVCVPPNNPYGGGFCGDNSCNNSETCNSCAPDCGECNGGGPEEPSGSCSVAAGTNKMTGCVYNNDNLTSYSNTAPEGPTVSSPADSNITALNFNNLSTRQWQQVNCGNRWVEDPYSLNGEGGYWQYSCESENVCTSPTGKCENYSAMWRGNFTFTGGNYQFTSNADDGYRLFLCDTGGNNCSIVVDRWSGGIGNNNTNTSITAGQKQVRVEFKQGGGGANIYVNWNLDIPLRPDLVASAPTPSLATVGSPITFSSLITNGGSASTGSGFNNFFQVASGANGGTPVDLASTAMGALSTGASANATSPSYTFSSSGTYSVRACADKTNPSNTGVITESDENNNCSSWTTVTVSNAPVAGSCGTASGKTYASAVTGYSPDVQCAAGTPSNTSFPAIGTTINWTCSGANGGANSGTCSATRSNAPIAGTCGTANGKTYAASAAGYAPDTQCAAGTPSSTGFPAAGGSTTWTCSGANGGANSGTCSASRSAVAVPVNGTCGSADGRAYANGSSSFAPYAQCSAGSPSSTAFPSAGSSVTWTCSGQSGGAQSSNCSASQSNPPPPPPPPTYLISLTKGGYGSVVSGPSGINCGNSCTYQSVSFNSGTSVTLTPTTGSNRIFVGWGGDCSSAGKGVCTLNMDSNKTVIAVFTIDPTYQEF